MIERVACPRGCGNMVAVSFRIDEIGRVVDVPDLCPCARNERRRELGLCRDCTNAVDGRVGVALRCNYCRERKAVAERAERTRQEALDRQFAMRWARDPSVKSQRARGLRHKEKRRARFCMSCHVQLPKPGSRHGRKLFCESCDHNKVAIFLERVPEHRTA